MDLKTYIKLKLLIMDLKSLAFGFQCFISFNILIEIHSFGRNSDVGDEKC